MRGKAIGTKSLFTTNSVQRASKKGKRGEEEKIEMEGIELNETKIDTYELTGKIAIVVSWNTPKTNSVEVKKVIFSPS